MQKALFFIRARYRARYKGHLCCWTAGSPKARMTTPSGFAICKNQPD
jgi:hypothetical protein